MSEERPDALLKSALEKIIYFEARSEQLQNDVATARADAERLRSELAAATRRELDLRRQLAEREVQAAQAQRDREEGARLVAALKSERAGLLGKLIEASRIQDADHPQDAEPDFDLASFISELRSEVIAQRGVAAEEPAGTHKPELTSLAPPLPKPPSPVEQHAQRLLDEGRLRVTEQQLLDLSRSAALPGRTEESLLSFSLRELAARDPDSRGRAAERLKALGSAAAAPALATALNAEAEPRVQVQLLAAFAALAGPEGAQVVAPHLGSPVAEVRIAALKAMLALEPSQAAPHLSAAMKDPDRSVRRRASLLALGLAGDAALRLGEQAVVDEDAEVRALGARALGAGGGEKARTLLLQALKDPEVKVRQAAAESLSRLLGQDVSPVVGLDDAQRRREIRRIASLKPLSAPRPRPVELKPRVLPAPAPVVPAPAPVASAPARVARTAVAVVEAPAVSEELCRSLLAEIRCAIRGRTFEDLLASAGSSPVDVERACALLMSRGQVVRRGLKYFVA